MKYNEKVQLGEKLADKFKDSKSSQLIDKAVGKFKKDLSKLGKNHEIDMKLKNSMDKEFD